MIWEFSSLGFIGKLIPMQELPTFAHFILLLHNVLPVDWILDEVFWSRYCYLPEYSCVKRKKLDGRLRAHRPVPLFQHVGKTSSLRGKVQNLRENKFIANRRSPIPLRGSGNPTVAEIKSNAAGIEEPAVRIQLEKFYSQGTPVRFVPREGGPLVITFVYGEDSPPISRVELHYAVKLAETTSTATGEVPLSPEEVEGMVRIGVSAKLQSQSGSPMRPRAVWRAELPSQSHVPFFYEHQFGVGVGGSGELPVVQELVLSVDAVVGQHEIEYLQLSFIRLVQ